MSVIGGAREKQRRFILMIIAIAVTAVGVSLSKTADLGITPMSSLPYVLSLIMPLTMGTFMTLMNLILVVVQWIILKDRFTKEHLFQVVASFVFGLFLDLFNWMLQDFVPGNYMLRWLVFITGTVILSSGIVLQVYANFTLLPTEGLVNVVSEEFKINFGKFKTTFDSSLAITAITLSLIFLRRLEGIGPGTIFGAIFIGQIVNFVRPKLAFVMRFIKG